MEPQSERQTLENVRVKSKAAAQDDPDVRSAVARVTDELGERGRVLVRASGTEPVLRVMVEADDEAVSRKYVDEVLAVLKDRGHIA